MEKNKYKEIIYEKPEDHIGVLTLNRAHKVNALSMSILAEIRDALEVAEEDKEVRVLIIRGEGKNFSAGIDIKESGAQKGNTVWQFMNMNLHGTIKKVRLLTKPVIFAVHGYVIGGALEMMISGDYVVAGESTKFYMPEIITGFPSIVEVALLPRQIGILQAKELVFFGEEWDIERIKSLKMVNRVVPDDQLIDAAMEEARKLAEVSPVALRIQKEVCNKWLYTDLETAIDYSKALITVNFASEDKEEGMRAYLERRKPDFKGR
jgi:enoyl-CoA hydratase